MAYNNVNEQAGVGSAPSIPQKAAQGVQAEQLKDSSPKVEDKLEREGHLPGLGEVQHDHERDTRQPGEVDAAGNKIHHKGILKKMLHWEHNGMNAD